MKSFPPPVIQTGIAILGMDKVFPFKIKLAKSVFNTKKQSTDRKVYFLLPEKGGKDKFMKIKLKNDTIISVLDSTTPSQIKATFEDVFAMDSFRSELTDDNLSVFQYLNETDEVIGEYENYTLVNTSYVVSDGLYHATFSLRKYTETELRLNALETEQSLQNGAIDELASIVGGE